MVDIFATLGERLHDFGTTAKDCALMAHAIEQNPWFTEEDICYAIRAISEDMLQRDKLAEWLKHYKPIIEPKDVAVIMAGNIPLVGFFDLLCVVASGHKLHIKPSSKDSILMSFVVEELRKIYADIQIFDYKSDSRYDMAIATGGDEANRYFEEHFATTRHLLRGSRHSVAILDGTESDAELLALSQDITRYSGLGCRSVSMLLVPRGWRGTLPHTPAINAKLNNNIRTMRAMLTMQQRTFIDCGGFLALHGEAFPTSLAMVTLREYDSLCEAQQWLVEHAQELQCVVSHCDIEGCVALGTAQRPSLWDYADGVDTMAFLREY